VPRGWGRIGSPLTLILPAGCQTPVPLSTHPGPFLPPRARLATTTTRFAFSLALRGGKGQGSPKASRSTEPFPLPAGEGRGEGFVPSNGGGAKMRPAAATAPGQTSLPSPGKKVRKSLSPRSLRSFAAYFLTKNLTYISKCDTVSCVKGNGPAKRQAMRQAAAPPRITTWATLTLKPASSKPIPIKVNQA